MNVSTWIAPKSTALVNIRISNPRHLLILMLGRDRTRKIAVEFLFHFHWLNKLSPQLGSPCLFEAADFSEPISPQKRPIADRSSRDFGKRQKEPAASQANDSRRLERGSDLRNDRY